VTRIAVIASLALLAVVPAGCGTKDSASTSAAAAPAGRSASCPAAWKSGWQRLADDVGTTVYCPRWMPRPLDAHIGGVYKNGRWVDPKDHSYLVSFVWVDHDSGVSQEVHVNFRGYPGRTTIPACQSTNTVNGKTIRKPVPCFADPGKTKRIGGITATIYTVNQGIDEWHVLYLWRHAGSLYTVSQHVIAPYTYSEVVANLERIIRGLVPLEPAT
jgi:hypothetical protein